ncbi:MAG: hypothetical protein IT393_10710 [Nitrospirae bacterium]|nr:hypothetical protein [Nitrospirota bacterium]
MRLYVLKPIKLMKAGKVFDVSPGGIVEILKPEKAQALISAGYVRPILPDEVKDVQAARIFSKTLNEEVWILRDPEAATYIPENAITFTIAELKLLKGASPEEIQAVHRVKKELSGTLISVLERKEKSC